MRGRRGDDDGDGTDDGGVCADGEDDGGGEFAPPPRSWSPASDFMGAKFLRAVLPQPPLRFTKASSSPERNVVFSECIERRAFTKAVSPL